MPREHTRSEGTIYEHTALHASGSHMRGRGSRTSPVARRVRVCLCGVTCERRRDRDHQRLSAARIHKAGWRLCFWRATIASPLLPKESSSRYREAYAESSAGATCVDPVRRSWTVSAPERGLRTLFYSEVPSKVSVPWTNQRRILTWIA